MVATILGIMFRAERPAGLAFVGMGFVIVGAWLSSRREAGPISK
jgi:drug/metabolite transporter (DMT)-like permease